MKVMNGRAVAIAAALVGLVACGGSGGESAAGATGTGGAGSASSTSSSASASSGGGGGSGDGGGCHGGSSGSSASSGAGGGEACQGPGARYATSVVSACFGAGEDHGRDQLPGIVLGPPKGGGCCGGSLDVASLGDGGTITLAFGGDAIVDGPGVDFIVFENAFNAGNDPKSPFAEPGTVEVSADGVTWKAFPCTATAYPYGGCAGWHPVYGNLAKGIDPLDPKIAGGDQFDLADVGVPLARFVRITDRADLPGSFDLDAVGIVNAACP